MAHNLQPNPIPAPCPHSPQAYDPPVTQDDIVNALRTYATAAYISQDAANPFAVAWPAYPVGVTTDGEGRKWAVMGRHPQWPIRYYWAGGEVSEAEYKIQQVIHNG